MLKKTSLLVVAFAFLCCVSSAYAQNQRGPSTPEERKQTGRVIGKQQAGTLAEHVKTGMASCMKIDTSPRKGT
jgi:hypothetical protein